MCHRTKHVTEDYLKAVDLPNHGKTYTVIPHGHIIDSARQELSKAGFTVDRELYKSTVNGDVAQGVYHLVSDKDPDMGMMFAWSNSYNKAMRFKCAIGGQVFVCMNGVVSGDMASYQRKHTGTALQEATGSIEFQILHAEQFFNKIIADKEALKQVKLTTLQKSHIVGELLIDKQIISSTQVSLVMREINKPTFQYNADPDSAWTLYNHITHALKLSHPLTYLNDHQKLHQHFVMSFVQPATQPALSQVYVSAPVQEVPVLESSDFTPNNNMFGVNFM
jgi:hypothetical protein